MNSLRQVLRTYLHRPRFAVLSVVCCLMILLGMRAGYDPWRIAVSANIACVAACFVALHLRRQFGNAPAKLLPGFAVPHLIVAAAISASIWVGLPVVESWVASGLPWPSITIHAFAGLLLAVAVCWPKAVGVMALLPVALFLALTMQMPHGSFAESFFAGRESWVYGIAIGLVVLAHPVAAWFLLRLPDQNSGVSDDFSSEAPQTHRAPGYFANLVLAGRDAVVVRRLAGAGRGRWTVQRWRVPVAVTSSQLILTSLAVAVPIGLVYYGSKQTYGPRETGDAAWLAMVLATGLLLIAPYGPWHYRRNWMAAELMRPVTRKQYFRELSVALACDVCLWAGLATAIILVADLIRIEFPPAGLVSFRWTVASTQLITLWGAAAFLYGVGLATLRFRYWMPLMTLLGIAWTVAIFVATGVADSHMRHSEAALIGALRVSLVAAGLGLILATIGYVRNVTADVN